MLPFNDNASAIGHTPLVRLNRVAPGAATVYAKVESRNPAFSVKDRVAASLVAEAEKDGRLKPGMRLLEASSGNTGIGLAYVAAAKGYHLTLVMQSGMSDERLKLLKMLGAEVLLTDPELGMQGAVAEAERLEASAPQTYYYTRQFENPANPLVHEQTTGPEIWEALAGRVDVVVAGVGTGGTITGLGRYFKHTQKAEVRTVAVEPASLPALSKHLAGQPLEPAGSLIQGIGAGFVPKVLDFSVVDQVEAVRDRDAIVMARRLAREEGLLCGISSGAAVVAAAKLAADPAYAGKNIVVILPDGGDRYVSTVLYSDLFEERRAAAHSEEPVAKLFETFKLRGLTLRNRVGVSPMCMYSAVDGLPQAWHLPHLGSRAVGGAGLVMAEATGVLPEGRITPGCTGIWSDAHAQAWAPIAAFIKSQGAVAGIQLAHAGRKASAALPQNGGASLDNSQGGWDTVAPSPLAFGAGLIKVPQALDAAGLQRVIEGFSAAAGRAVAAGFEWIEIHAAHGYLLHQFLSPLSNHRSDELGQGLQGRMRFPLAVAAAVREAVPEHLPVAVRLSATDWAENGWDLEQSIEFAMRLKAVGIDLIDVSTGGNVPDAKIPVGPGFQVPFSEAIRREAVIPTAAVGMITEPAQAESILQSGQADQVLLARAFLRDPYWAHHAAQALGVPEACKLPIQYGRA